MPIGPWIATHTPGGRLMFASLGAAGAITGLSSHFVYTAGLVALGGALLHVHRNQMRAAAQHRQELALRKELLAYLLFSGSPRTMVAAELGRQISRLMAVRSSFGRAALLLRDDTGTLSIAGSAGFDDLSVEALNRWGRAVSATEMSLVEIAMGHERVGTSSFTLTLDRRDSDRNPLSTMNCKRVHIVPLRAAHGIFGALVVCTELRPAARATDALELLRSSAATPILPLADLLQPVEALGLRLTMQLAACEGIATMWPVRSLPRQDSAPNSYAERGAGRLKHGGKGRSRSTGGVEAAGGAVRGAETNRRRRLDEAALPLDASGLAASIEKVRRVLNPAAAPVERVAGVSGRPPVHVWRQGGGELPS